MVTTLVLLRRIRENKISSIQFDARLEETTRRLETVLRLNRELANARDEHTLVQAALSAVNNLTNAIGVSFVPFDTWGQPMPAYTFGGLPEPVLKGWAEHLISEQTRERCSTCQLQNAPSGHSCPLKVGHIRESIAIFCLPLSLGDRALGMVNVYLSPEGFIDDEQHRFLESILSEMALAVETVRLHNQELTVLRQLHRLRSPRSNLHENLQSFLDATRNALRLEALVLRVRPLSDERLSNLRVQSGHLPPLPPEIAADPQPDALTSLSAPFTAQAVPLMLPEGQSMGILAGFSRQPGGITPREVNLLQTAAAQAALMVENERQTLTLEYTLVIQERTRLAREIHDGLAQTLAFLKMQANQMQTALHNTDIARLERLLGENHRALNDAYNDIRQAIDNLRFAPEDTLPALLRQLGRAFQNGQTIRVDYDFQATDLDLLPEIQAQLVRIVQEALNNVRKHAQANRVLISLREWSGELIIEIIDDGQGFDPDDLPSIAQYGLRGMRERAESIGADFQIISQPQCGTTVKLSLPATLKETNA
ncbi:MAG: GAF domain-containing sensor histidine kinase [Anaerolineae bacterium]|nr:GAF domain-containing sensor histidine kinase [Anaerolineae bacterium]